MSLPLPPLLLALLLVAAAPAVQAQSESPSPEATAGLDRGLAALKAGGSEFYLYPLPQGWTWQAVDRETPYYAMTFLPDGQPQRGWDDALILSIHRGEAMEPRDLLGWAERRLATACRDLRRSGVEQGAGADDWPEAWRLFVCRERLDNSRGEVRLLRAVQGESASYLAARVWRMPVFASGSPVGQSEVQQARDLLAEGGPCLRDSARSACPLYSAMGLGALEDAVPYGVFNVRSR